MTFLDPYSKDRRVPLVWIARVLLLAAVAVIAWLLFKLVG
jgi:hypothetical protein